MVRLQIATGSAKHANLFMPGYDFGMDPVDCSSIPHGNPWVQGNPGRHKHVFEEKRHAQAQSIEVQQSKPELCIFPAAT